jgi:hypothetical protein
VKSVFSLFSSRLTPFLVSPIADRKHRNEERVETRLKEERLLTAPYQEGRKARSAENKGIIFAMTDTLREEFEPEPDSSACCNPWGRKKFKTSARNDADIAKEMNELSFEEREKVFDDVHGVAQVQVETPELVEQCIRNFDKYISEIPTKKRKAFNRASFFWPKLETDTKFKLMFLRADFYDAQKAAQRMVNYYEEKRALFGEEKLVKTITINDLEERDLDVFRLGAYLELPLTDQTGRPVFLFDRANFDFDRMSLDNQVSETSGLFWFSVG